MLKPYTKSRPIYIPQAYQMSKIARRRRLWRQNISAACAIFALTLIGAVLFLAMLPRD